MAHKPGVTITKDTDHGYKALLNRVYGIGKARPQIAVGILAASAGKPDGAATVLDVGTWNEFGTVDAEGITHTPSRSFIRAWFDENRSAAQKLLSTLMRRVIKGEITEHQALDQFGLWAVGQIQLRIASSIPPPNKQSTIDQKGSSVPLIDTGVLRSSVSFEIRKG